MTTYDTLEIAIVKLREQAKECDENGDVKGSDALWKFYDVLTELQRGEILDTNRRDAWLPPAFIKVVEIEPLTDDQKAGLEKIKTL